MGRPKVATLSLASCTGCHMALVDNSTVFLNLLSTTQLAFSPLLVDSKRYHGADLVLIEGGIRRTEDRDLLASVRADARALVALGTCAVFGGVPGLANQGPVDQLVDDVYGESSLGPEAAALCSRLTPVDQVVEVDYYIPGCPPPAQHLGQVLAALLVGQDPPRVQTPVCSECGRTAGPEPLTGMVRSVATSPVPDKCLLVQGYLCLGSVTRGGCGAACTHANVPCTGCRGPTDRLLLESTHGIYRDIVSRISHLLEIPAAEVERQLGDLPHTLYAYSLASQSLRRKDAERVARFVHRIEE